MKISVAVLGSKVTVEVENGANASDALQVFESLSGKLLTGMDVFKNGDKVANLAETPLEDGDNIVAVKSKHESAAKITLKVLGNKFEVDCEEDSNCAEALAVFERVTTKALSGMDLFRDGEKLTPEDVLNDGDTVVAVKSKHESAAKITLKVLGNEFEVECDDNSNCNEAFAVFERITEKALSGMDVFRDGEKLTGEDVLKDGDTIVAVKSKHESA